MNAKNVASPTIERTAADLDVGLLTKPEVAAMFRVCPRTVENWMSRDGLPHFRLSANRTRFRRDEVLGWFERRFSVRRAS